MLKVIKKEILTIRILGGHHAWSKRLLTKFEITTNLIKARSGKMEYRIPKVVKWEKIAKTDQWVNIVQASTPKALTAYGLDPWRRLPMTSHFIRTGDTVTVVLDQPRGVILSIG